MTKSFSFHAIGGALMVTLFFAHGCKSTSSASTTGPEVHARASTSATSGPDASHSNAQRLLYCQAFPEGNTRENCFMRAAVEAKETALCANAGSIRSLCVIGVAAATSDSAPCAAIAEPRDAVACVMAAAMHASSDAVCDPLLDVPAREATCNQGAVAKESCAIWRSPAAPRAAVACKAVATGAAQACEALPAHDDGSREMCLHHLAVRTKTASLCALLHEDADPQLDAHENDCLADVGVASKSAADCARIPHGKTNPAFDLHYQVCLMAAASRDPAICARLPSGGIKEHDDVARRQCLSTVGVPCPEIGVNACLAHWQMSVADTSLCDGSPWGNDGDGCALTVAMNTRNGKACDVIVDASMKSACAKLTAP